MSAAEDERRDTTRGRQRARAQNEAGDAELRHSPSTIAGRTRALGCSDRERDTGRAEYEHADPAAPAELLIEENRGTDGDDQRVAEEDEDHEADWGPSETFEERIGGAELKSPERRAEGYPAARRPPLPTGKATGSSSGPPAANRRTSSVNGSPPAS